MDMSPQRVRGITFSTVKKGYDITEVNTFVSEVATALEVSQNETAAMEARARAAVARLQELSTGASGESADGATAKASVSASVDEAETISRALLLAQRTADVTVADAQAEAERLLSAARDDAASSLDQARSMADQLVSDGRDEARQAYEQERLQVEAEVQSLMARRDFLESDVTHLEEYVAEQRSRIREAAISLTDIVDRVPGGLGETRPPLLSAAHEDDTTPTVDPGAASDEPSDSDEPVVGDALGDAVEHADDDTGELYLPGAAAGRRRGGGGR